MPEQDGPPPAASGRQAIRIAELETELATMHAHVLTLEKHIGDLHELLSQAYTYIHELKVLVFRMQKRINGG